ncbi:MAG: UDP-N-acetylmuramoyl-L-alanine--D-glutamate ligase [Lachnospiraceae bacterium]|nr:UDP-N-acetylmuramoyl-L-alanine--D-glutamate ligase [Lachnospiraceae bacterium]
MDLKGKKIVVIGAGKSGISACKLLTEEGADITLYDSNEQMDVKEVRGRIGDTFAGKIVTGGFPKSLEEEAELIVISPGVPSDLDYLNRIRERGTPIWGEVELAYRFAKGKLIAVTGTNGKTTTTALTGEIMKLYFENVFVVGNIGTPYTDFAKQMTEDSVTVAEMSSFQLESIDEFHPCVSMVLNITPDHLNRHHTMEAYTAAKFNVAKNQTPGEVCILNYEDERLHTESKKLHTKVFWFSSARILKRGLYLSGDKIVYNDGTSEQVVIDVHELNIIGKHNYENAMAAIAAGISMNVPMHLIQEALRNFVAVEHRIEYTATKRGVMYYNDSKGTNPDASIQAVKAMDRPTILIGGGYDKGSSYEEWIKSFDGKIKLLLLMGQTAAKIELTARNMGFNDIIRVNSMEEAVRTAADHAIPGEAVLLSPCCASWGMFKNYEERGEIFKKLVRSLPD